MQPISSHSSGSLSSVLKPHPGQSWAFFFFFLRQLAEISAASANCARSDFLFFPHRKITQVSQPPWPQKLQSSIRRASHAAHLVQIPAKCCCALVPRRGPATVQRESKHRFPPGIFGEVMGVSAGCVGAGPPEP